MRLVFGLLAACLAGPAVADIVVATAIIRANTIIEPGSVGLKNGIVDGVHSDLSEVVGLEARKSIYPGRPLRFGDVGAPALVERNQIVTLIFSGSGLSIETDGRSLSRAGAGERLRVMNLASRSTITGIVTPDGNVLVSN